MFFTLFRLRYPCNMNTLFTILRLVKCTSTKNDKIVLRKHLCERKKTLLYIQMQYQEKST
ncbi:hypothetical protein Hdeb2414_s0022g00610181 [Helianthus debilis subsp. tardiflorus]